MKTSLYQSQDGLGLAGLIKTKQVTTEELIDAAFEQINKVNDQVNAVIRTRRDKAIQEARNVTNRGQTFLGVPIIVKDISQAVAGEKLTAGSHLLKHNLAKQDSNYVARLRQVGFSIIGHSNTPEFGLRNITEPDLYGASRNPWNLAYSPGGSSGGAASAVAAGMVPIAGASDGGGSIRIPASFSGLVGLKPTRGRTPVGPGVGRQWQGAAIDFALTRSVRDCAAMLDAMQVVQQEAAFQTPLFAGGYLQSIRTAEKQKFRIGFTTESPVGTPVSEEAIMAVQKTARWLESEGHIVEKVSSPVNGRRLIENYYIMNNGEMASEFFGLEEMIGRKIKSTDVDIVSWVLAEAGKYVTAVEYSRSLAEWDLAAAQMAHFHQTYDLFLTPATAFTAPRVGELTQSKSEIDYLLTISDLPKAEHLSFVYEMFLPSLTYSPFTQLANLTGQPAISLPVHLTKGKLPLGIQLMAPKGKEEWLLNLAAVIEQSELWIGMKGNSMLS